MKCTWHAHSVVKIETINDYKIIIDPFINGNTLTDLKVENIKVDYIVLTHGHNDHVGDALEISLNNDAPIIAMVELADLMESLGAKVHPMNIGGSHKFPFGTLKFTQAIHSSHYTYENKSIPVGLAAGVIVNDGASTLYHAGDTALFSDMKLIGPVDVAFIPIGDNFTMGINDALLAAEYVDAGLVVPIHYDTFDIIKQNPYEFINRLELANGLVPEIGEPFDIN